MSWWWLSLPSSRVINTKDQRDRFSINAAMCVCACDDFTHRKTEMDNQRERKVVRVIKSYQKVMFM